MRRLLVTAGVALALQAGSVSSMRAAPATPAEPAVKPPPGVSLLREFRLEGPVLARLKQRGSGLDGINGVLLRRYGQPPGKPDSRLSFDAVRAHYAAEMDRLGWYALLTDSDGRRKGVAYSSQDGDWLFAVNVDARGIVTSLVNGKISLEQMPELERILLKMLAARPGDLPTAEDLDVLRRADDLVRAGKPSEAEQTLTAAVANSPRSFLLRRKLADIYREQGRRPEALAQLKAVVALDPAGYNARMDYARALMEVGDHQAAVFEFSQAAALVPDRGAPRYFSGRCYQAMGKLDQALSAYTAASEMAPHWTSVQVRIGEIFEAQGRLDKAGDAFRRALRSDPGSSEAAEGLKRVTQKQQAGE